MNYKDKIHKITKININGLLPNYFKKLYANANNRLRRYTIHEGECR